MAALTATGSAGAYNATVRIASPSAVVTVQSARADQSAYRANDPVTGQPMITGASRGAVNTRHMPLLFDWEQ